ncbi:kynurenine--oxoglutarate transaminase [Reticulomyxa filosa]|uniref:Kynurenine--oxoglutarate transaminase n=1 Tax=Reticulomyxa filosa TaxID=46433 RepID=X6MES1_RETFI|nr:kynurenine--oxoglutarate transaminase [Reticulomyxa filosa]|eukprot:ETO12181.1 kynurenine--oxoglutarate transaminase [Reticulomyxa filosa]
MQALADALKEADKPFDGFDNYYMWLKSMYENKRNLLVEMISKNCNMKPIVPQGTFFVCADASMYINRYQEQTTDSSTHSNLLSLEKSELLPDWKFVAYLIQNKNINVATIPMSAFFEFDEDRAKDDPKCIDLPTSNARSFKNGLTGGKFGYIRFTFCVSEKTILSIGQRFNNVTNFLKDIAHLLLLFYLKTEIKLLQMRIKILKKSFVLKENKHKITSYLVKFFFIVIKNLF